MSEKIAVVYIGPKPVKKDTLTGSRTLFPRLEPVHVDSALAWQLLAFPDVWGRQKRRKVLWLALVVRMWI